MILFTTLTLTFLPSFPINWATEIAMNIQTWDWVKFAVDIYANVYYVDIHLIAKELFQGKKIIESLTLSQMINRFWFFEKMQVAVRHKGLTCVFYEGGLKMWKDVVLKKEEAWWHLVCSSYLHWHFHSSANATAPSFMTANVTATWPLFHLSPATIIS